MICLICSVVRPIALCISYLLASVYMYITCVRMYVCMYNGYQVLKNYSSACPRRLKNFLIYSLILSPVPFFCLSIQFQQEIRTVKFVHVSAMQTYRGIDLQPHVSLTSALDVEEWLVSRFGHFNYQEIYLSTH